MTALFITLTVLAVAAIVVGVVLLLKKKKKDDVVPSTKPEGQPTPDKPVKVSLTIEATEGGKVNGRKTFKATLDEGQKLPTDAEDDFLKVINVKADLGKKFKCFAKDAEGKEVVEVVSKDLTKLFIIWEDVK